MDALINQDREPSDDSRLVYVKPELIDAGKIADVTLSDGNNSGSDSTYS